MVPSVMILYVYLQQEDGTCMPTHARYYQWVPLVLPTLVVLRAVRIFNTYSTTKVLAQT